jgi:hypothetical protein
MHLTEVLLVVLLTANILKEDAGGGGVRLPDATVRGVQIEPTERSRE